MYERRENKTLSLFTDNISFFSEIRQFVCTLTYTSDFCLLCLLEELKIVYESFIIKLMHT